MVEMLGTLAIIGVLSVVGLAVYRVAVDKHRANTVINEANKRATIMTMQFQQGTTEGSLNEFDNDLGYAVFNSSVITSPDNENQFQISFTTPPETSVCQQIKSLIPATSVIRKITDNCDTFTYNKDLSSTVYASDFNNNEEACVDSDRKWCSYTITRATFGACSDNTDCCEGVVWDSRCHTCNSSTGNQTDISGLCDLNQDGTADDGYCENGACVVRPDCPEGTKRSGTEGYAGGIVPLPDGTNCYCPTGLVYTSSGCQQQPSICTSWTENQCGKGYYCKFTTYTKAATANSANYKNAYTNVSGTCQSLPAFNWKHTINFGLKGKRTLYKYGVQNWWSAASICNTNHNGMAEATDLGFGVNKDGVQIGEYATTAGCAGNACPMHCACGEHQKKCVNSSALGCSDGICDCWNYFSRSDIFHLSTFWTKNAYGKEADDSSIDAFVFVINSSRSNCRISRSWSNPRNYGNGIFVLCK